MTRWISRPDQKPDLVEARHGAFYDIVSASHGPEIALRYHQLGDPFSAWIWVHPPPDPIVTRTDAPSVTRSGRRPVAP